MSKDLIHQAFRPQAVNPSLTLTNPASFDSFGNFTPLTTADNLTHHTLPSHSLNTDEMEYTSNSEHMTDVEDTSILARPSNPFPGHHTGDAAPGIGIAAARFITSSESDLVRLTCKELTTYSSEPATPRLPCCGP